VGETILRMKARLWFLHRGVERLFVGRQPAAAIELTERISGDTAVGHSLAYALAVEEALGVQVPERTHLTRALLLELERVYNHVGDLGAMANDVGFSFVNAHALRLREELLRLNDRTTGHRLLRGGIGIGGATVRALPDPTFLAMLAVEVEELVAITLGNSTVWDRFTGTAVLRRPSALELGTLGYVARASGVPRDARADHPFCELPGSFQVTTEEDGDVLARYRVRVGEIAVSLRLIGELSKVLATGTDEIPGHPDVVLDTAAGPGHGLGLVEGWRGRIAHRVALAPDGTLARVKVVDPSFFNWPALAVALADTIVPDFPLANKSFNQSYAGNDL
jgi:Ni,Fe-hydrogenase III large subunit